MNRYFFTARLATSYTIEIVAEDEDEALAIAQTLSLKEWEECKADAQSGVIEELECTGVVNAAGIESRGTEEVTR